VPDRVRHDVPDDVREHVVGPDRHGFRQVRLEGDLGVGPLEAGELLADDRRGVDGLEVDAAPVAQVARTVSTRSRSPAMSSHHSTMVSANSRSRPSRSRPGTRPATG